MSNETKGYVGLGMAGDGRVEQPQGSVGMSVHGRRDRVRTGARRASGFYRAVATVFMLLCSLLVTAQAAETVTYYYTSPQGTVLATADSAGNVLSSADYRPYGSQALGTPEQGPGYTGHVNDVDSGLVYMQARYYDPAVGRFISTDPAGVAGGDIFAVSRFAYASNNPIGNSDPDGRQSVPQDAYSRYWSVSPADQEKARPNGNAAFVMFMLTQSDVLDVAPADSGSGAVASSGFPGEFLVAGGALKGASMLSSLSRGGVELAALDAAALPRMRVMDITAKGAAERNYSINWTQDQFESHLSNNGYTMTQRGPVNVWFDSRGTKVFTTRDFSKSGGPTGELFHSGQSTAVAKFRFDQNLSP